MNIVKTPRESRAGPIAADATGYRKACVAVAMVLAAYATLITPVIASDSGATSDAAQRDARTTAPNFVLPDRNETPVRLDDLRGDVVYVDFWASWCPPCLKSFPWMNELAERHAADGLTIVAISLDGNRADAERFLDEARADFDVVFDPEASSAQAFDVVGMPSSFVIDRDGRIAYTHVGFRRKDMAQIEQAVAAALAESSPTMLQADAGDAER